MNKHLIKTTFLLLSLLISINSNAQEQLEKSIEEDRTIEVDSSKIFKVTEAFYTNQTDSINLFEQLDDKTFYLSLTPNPNTESDSIFVSAGNLPKKVLFIGEIIYNNSVKYQGLRNDVYKGKGISVFNKEKQPIDFAIEEIPDSEEQYGKAFYSFWVYYADMSMLLFNGYELE